MENKKNFYIDGKWVTPKSKEEIKVINPATEENCAVISLGNKEDVELAVSSAKNAYSSWSFSKKEERIKLLEKLYENYKKRWADIADAITIEIGAPKDFASKLQAGYLSPQTLQNIVPLSDTIILETLHVIPEFWQNIISSPPRPNTKGSPPLRRITVLPSLALLTKTLLIQSCEALGPPGLFPTSINSQAIGASRRSF